MLIEIGLSAEKTLIVSETHSAIQMGSGDVSVLATPALLALMEGAAAAAIVPHLVDGQTSVGTFVDLKHLKATAIGKTVRARAEVVAIDGRMVHFSIQAWEGDDLIGDGVHHRAIVDRDRFMARMID